jgi:hypothetical protein
MNYFNHPSRLALAFWCLATQVLANEPGYVLPAHPNDPALEAVLQKQIETEEGVQLQSIIKSDLEASFPGEERVVLWVLLGATYWSSHLSVLSEKNGQWQQLATLSLDGAEATLDTVASDGLITVNAKTAGPNDPVCCPSQVKTLQYRYAKGQLIAASTGAQP